MGTSNNQFRFDNDLSKIVSYLTFDGHLAKDLSCFYMCSKEKRILFDFRRLIEQKFGLIGNLEINNESNRIRYKYRYYNTKVGRFLLDVGTPKGCKVKQEFRVPLWIRSNLLYSFGYVCVAFDCEGGFWVENNNYLKIRFGQNKDEKLLDNGLLFISDIKNILCLFGIKTTKTWITKSNIRKDGIITKSLYFKIKQRSVHQFIKTFDFFDKFKNSNLSLL